MAQGPPMVSRNFQSLDDFMREQDQLDAVRSADMKARAAIALANPHSKKFKKAPPPLDAEVIAAEARAVAEIAQTNWTGRLGGVPWFLFIILVSRLTVLLEYRAAHPTAASVKALEYKEIGTSRFKCIATIHEAPHIQFGQDITLSFAKKKEAKQWASKKAIDWLIASGFMPPDGSVRWPKPTPLPPSKIIGPKIPAAAQATVAKGKNTFTAQIPPLAHRLGFSPPTYVVDRISDEGAFYNGHAHWPNDHRLSGKVGLVSNVFGQKNAKELIAQEVFAFLTDIEKQRTAKWEDVQGEGGKDKSSEIENPTREGAKDNGVKIDSDNVERSIERLAHDETAKDEHIQGNPANEEHHGTDDEDRKRKRTPSPEEGEDKAIKAAKLEMAMR